ncbi:MAG: hypothetical protein GX195_09455 [Firmicutes bacterium]|jgi:hypothetical protein|nr:hypothetical protein [Bacillota bacterium]
MTVLHLLWLVCLIASASAVGLVKSGHCAVRFFAINAAVMALLWVSLGAAAAAVVMAVTGGLCAWLLAKTAAGMEGME